MTIRARVGEGTHQSGFGDLTGGAAFVFEFDGDALRPETQRCADDAQRISTVAAQPPRHTVGTAVDVGIDAGARDAAKQVASLPSPVASCLDVADIDGTDVLL